MTGEGPSGADGGPSDITVAAGRMHRDGYMFYLSANGVWLTDAVPPGYLSPGCPRQSRQTSRSGDEEDGT